MAEEKSRHLVLEANREEVGRNVVEEGGRYSVLGAELQEIGGLLNVWGNN